MWEHVLYDQHIMAPCNCLVAPSDIVLSRQQDILRNSNEMEWETISFELSRISCCLDNTMSVSHSSATQSEKFGPTASTLRS